VPPDQSLMIVKIVQRKATIDKREVVSVVTDRL
jgi:hypothetical protein